MKIRLRDLVLENGYTDAYGRPMQPHLGPSETPPKNLKTPYYKKVQDEEPYVNHAQKGSSELSKSVNGDYSGSSD